MRASDRRWRRGLYAITAEAICGAALLPAVAAALRGGAVMIQYRDKWSAPAQREHNARALVALCESHAAALIVNDDPALAQRVGAHGVHLGQTDASLAQARALLGRDAIVGVSCSNRLAHAVQAAEGGASYVAFGRFFESRTKPGAPPAGLALLREARGRIGLPICAIGGITPDTAATLLEAGADLLAAVDGVFGGADAEHAARAYAAAFARR